MSNNGMRVRLSIYFLVRGRVASKHLEASEDDLKCPNENPRASQSNLSFLFPLFIYHQIKRHTRGVSAVF